MSKEITAGVTIENQILILPVLSRFVDDPAVDGAAVFSKSKKKFANIEKDNNPIFLADHSKTQETNYLIEGRELIITEPIFLLSDMSLLGNTTDLSGGKDAGKEVVGYVVVRVSRNEFLKEFRTLTAVSFLIFSLILLQLYFLFDYLAKRVTEPVTSLRKKVIALQAGTHLEKPTSVVKNEIGDLETAFYTLSVQLLAKQEEIQLYVNNLEEKVRDRTRDLSEKNSKLLELNVELEQLKTSLLAEIKRGNYITSNMKYIIHSLHNPANLITGYSNMLLSKQHTFEDRKDFIKYIQVETLRIEELVRKTARLFVKTLYIVDLDQLVLKAVRDIGTLPHVQISTNFQSAVLMDGDPLQLKECITNILMNSIQAKRKENAIKIDVFSKRSNYSFYLTITDNGPGISQEVVDNIFSENMFYSIRTGLKGFGLPSTKFIIEEIYGGKMTIFNTGKGTQVQFIIPINERKTN
jgi:signal transduction histidine kinase